VWAAPWTFPQKSQMSNLGFSNYGFDRNVLDQLSEKEFDILIEHLERIIVPERLEKMKRVLAHRTSYVQVLVEDVQKIHNAHAVLRSSECFGIQHVHFSKLSPGKQKVAPGIVKGSHKWVDLHMVQGNDTEDYGLYLENLKKQGYRLLAAEPSDTCLPLQDIPLDKPMVLLFGTENFGLSELATAKADLHYHVPMVGFTESLNVSVSAALSLHAILNRLKNSEHPWQLSSEERKRTLAKWLISDVHKPQVHIRKALGRSLT